MLGFVQARSLDIQNGLETALGLKLDWGRSVALGAFALLEISYIFLISLFRKLVSFPNNKHKGAEPWQPMAFHGSLEHCFNWTVACPETVSQNHVRITVLGV